MCTGTIQNEINSSHIFIISTSLVRQKKHIFLCYIKKSEIFPSSIGKKKEGGVGIWQNVTTLINFHYALWQHNKKMSHKLFMHQTHTRNISECLIDPFNDSKKKGNMKVCLRISSYYI